MIDKAALTGFRLPSFGRGVSGDGELQILESDESVVIPC
jgi:hypothetical protein